MTIYEHWQRGDLELPHKKGVLKFNVIFYCEINRAFLLARNSGNGYEDSIMITAEHMSVSDRTVKRAIQFVNQ